MNKKLITTLAAGVLVLGAQQVKALNASFDTDFQYRDADPIGVSIASGGSFLGGTFNIATGDADANTFTVNSAFGYLGGQHANETYLSHSGYTPLTPISGGEFDFWFHNSAGDTFTINVSLSALVSAASGPVTFKSDSLNATIIADLQADGIVNYSVLNAGPTAVTFDYAALGANVASTPDGGATAMLLGIGFLGAAGVRRKLS
jgi:hypothetical protein